MKNAVIACVIAVVSICLCMAMLQDNDVWNNLQQLQGTWVRKGTKGNMYEVWTPGERVMYAYSYTKKGNDSIPEENVLLHPKGGDIYYTVTTARQNNQQPVDFKLTLNTHNRFVFENPAHDYPKRIVYELVNADSIHAFIDDLQENGTNRIHFYFNRVP
jgi:hypothetical protein